ALPPRSTRRLSGSCKCTRALSAHPLRTPASKPHRAPLPVALGASSSPSSPPPCTSPRDPISLATLRAAQSPTRTPSLPPAEATTPPRTLARAPPVEPSPSPPPPSPRAPPPRSAPQAHVATARPPYKVNSHLLALPATPASTRQSRAHAMSDPAPPPPPRRPLSDEQIAQGLKALRQNFKVAAIAHWATLFGHHVGFDFDTEVSVAR
ncbi:hypothetical protein DMC30DRAFT_186626, partial [Rhodotorula diobovata]